MFACMYTHLSRRPSSQNFAHTHAHTHTHANKHSTQIDHFLRSQVLSNASESSNMLTNYIRTGKFPPESRAKHLASILLLHGVPSPLRLRRACADLSEMARTVPGGLASGGPLTAMVMKDVPAATAMLIARHVSAAAIS